MFESSWYSEPRTLDFPNGHSDNANDSNISDTFLFEIKEMSYGMYIKLS